MSDFWNNETPGTPDPNQEHAPSPVDPGEPAIPTNETSPTAPGGAHDAPPPAPVPTPPPYGGQPPYGSGGAWQNNGHYYNPSNPTGGPRQQPNYQWNYGDYNNPAPGGSGGGKKPKRNRGLVVFTVILCSILLLGVLFLAGFGLYAVVTQEHSSIAPPESSQVDGLLPDADAPGLNIEDKPAEDDNTVISGDGRLSTPEISRRVSPSVVGIVEYGAYQGQMYSGSGSGIIISADGYILTNAHVVSMEDGSDADGIEVILSDGSRLEAWLVGKDTRTDLAVIKVDAQNLPYADFGNSDQMEIGETVIAIGNPGGEDLAGSVSQGVISGLDRQIKTQADGYSINCLQTDAAINPGNSGGPLVNQFGQVIGINSAKLVQTEYEGIGFAIPINDAKPIVDQLIQYGKVTNRVRLGIVGAALNYNYAQYYGLPQGIRIISTDQGTDISTKGLRIGEVAGDIITHINGTPVATMDDIAQILNKHTAGDQVELTIYRVAYQGQREQTFDITITLVADQP